MSDAGVIVREEVACLLTHGLVPAGPIPTAFDPDGVYPYVSYVETAQRGMPRDYRLVVLENQHLRAVLCPDLGGRVISLLHRTSGRECLHMPEVVRPVRILPRFAFVPGGIEISFPIAHSPVQNETVLYDVAHDGGRAYVTCGEREIRYGMRWSAEFSLGPDDAFLTQRVRFQNPGRCTSPWTSWSCAALPVRDDTEFHFPGGPVLSHSSRLETIDWQQSGIRRQTDVHEMTGYFWRNPDVHAFGAFTPSLGSGLYHVADPSGAPGMKLWTYGTGADAEWSWLGDAACRPYIEIQGGPVADQSIKVTLAPDEERSYTEFWIPTDRPLDIREIPVSEVALRPISSVPLFDWARESDAGVWVRLMEDPTSSPPSPSEACWAPSGMDELEALFAERTRNAIGDSADVWQFHHGTWRAGRGEIDAAIALLSECRGGVARVLLARLLRRSGRLDDARRAMDSVTEPWLNLHPQVVAERDDLLRAIGPETLAGRQKWLDAVASLEEDRLRVRQVRLLLDRGDVREARDLLLATHFDKIHQSYERTSLWEEICRALEEPISPAPATLGEDRLARFGAYREYEEG